jgi:DNA-binding GntR family transcriptional regulator
MHDRIIAALEDHDIQKARQTMLEEVRSSRDAILDNVMEGSADNWHVID